MSNRIPQPDKKEEPGTRLRLLLTRRTFKRRDAEDADKAVAVLKTFSLSPVA